MATTQSLTDGVGFYEFGIYHFDTVWYDRAGVYAFVKWEAGKGCVPLYIGKTESFKTRLCASHDCWYLAMLSGATHVLALVEPNAIYRGNLEQRLINHYCPPLNVRGNWAFGGA